MYISGDRKIYSRLASTVFVSVSLQQNSMQILALCSKILYHLILLYREKEVDFASHWRDKTTVSSFPLSGVYTVYCDGIYLCSVVLFCLLFTGTISMRHYSLGVIQLLGPITRRLPNPNRSRRGWRWTHDMELAAFIEPEATWMDPIRRSLLWPNKAGGRTGQEDIKKGLAMRRYQGAVWIQAKRPTYQKIGMPAV